MGAQWGDPEALTWTSRKHLSVLAAAGEPRNAPGKAAHDGGILSAEGDLPAAARVLRVAPDPTPLRVETYRRANRDVELARKVRTVVRVLVWAGVAILVAFWALGVGWAKQDAYCATHHTVTSPYCGGR